MGKRRPLFRASLELANAANGVRPFGRDGYPTVPAFFLGWPTTEMAPLYIAGSVLGAGWRWLRGDYATGRGRIALLLKAITWGLLYLIHRRNVASEPYFDTPLRDTLGDDYEAVAAQSQPMARRRLAYVLPNELLRRRYVEKTDVVQYGPHPKVNFADVWRRRDLPRDGKAPVLLQVPGGGWSIGMRRPQAYPLMSHMAERGWVCVSIDYRVSPKNTWPAHIVDVKRALAWIKENIHEYGGDPDFVAITGGSAGGHLCALAALTPDDPQYQPGFEGADTSVAAAVPIYGRYDWFTTKGPGRWEFVLILLQRLVVKKRLSKHLQIYRDASPITRVRPDAPPFFILHGVDDSLIPVPEAREFVAAMREVSKETVVYSEIPHAQHAFDFFGSPRGYYTAHAVEKFLSWVHAHRDEK
ncbi:alpha/beta hydrolase [Mycobacterium sp. 1274761.0]|uniref:alpha/beta hydrolase n=1 Tax=Mycobacterium sp. 1274761.0 TaxID=1834077 RepID=UPI0007FE9D84|nr:alpha/beta hydrolase [Mycobacterium sp. 1274761.0]OBK74699.1 esterase [Mycobacterium sp. 1274761.0]